jgi:hypothetical protein
MKALLKKPEIYLCFKNRDFIIKELSFSMNLGIFMEQDFFFEWIVKFKLTRLEILKILGRILKEKYRGIDFLIINLQPKSNRSNDRIPLNDNFGFNFTNRLINNLRRRIHQNHPRLNPNNIQIFEDDYDEVIFNIPEQPDRQRVHNRRRHASSYDDKNILRLKRNDCNPSLLIEKEVIKLFIFVSNV